MINTAQTIDVFKQGGGHRCLKGPQRYPLGWVGLLDAEEQESVGGLLEKYVFEPIRDLRERPSKAIRRKLVRIGAGFGTCEVVDATIRRNLSVADEVVETLHAGSLIVDDIEDGSQMRRGQISIHCSYGLPVALNAANWMYFWPLHLIGSMEIPPTQELDLYRYYHQTLLRAHSGQAIDVGVDMESVAQPEVRELCLASLRLKTGALTAFALVMGATLAGLSEEHGAKLKAFGHGFGVVLQMFDDLGNLKASNGTKQFEDLRLRRPSWIWAVAAQYPAKDYWEFLQSVRRLPDRSYLQAWLNRVNFTCRAGAEARAYMTENYRELAEAINPRGRQVGAFKQLRKLGRSLERAYA